MASSLGLTRSSLFLLAIFVPAALYNGAGYNLHLLSVSSFLLFLWLAFTIARQDPSRFHIAKGWLPAFGIAYFVWLILAPLMSPYPYISSVRAAELAALPLALLAWLSEPQRGRVAPGESAFRLLLFAALALAVWAGIDFLVFHERAHGPLLDPNAFGALINLLLIPAIYVYLGVAERSHKTLPLLVTITILALALFMTLSRGALIAFVAILPALLWFARENQALSRRLPVLMLVLTTAYLFVKFGPVETNELKTGVEGLLVAPAHYLEHDSSIQTRLLLWTSTWRMILDSNILIGTGLGTFKTSYPPYRLEGEHSAGNFAHNDYLQALQEGGLPQLLFLITFTIAAPLWLLYKNRSKNTAAGGSPLIPAFMLGILCVSLQAMVNFIHLIVPIALLTGAYLAISWEAVTPRGTLCLLPKGSMSGRPWILKSFVIALLALQTLVIVMDGAVFKLLGTAESLIGYVRPQDRFAVLNAALALRPKNPTPRVILVRHLVELAEQEGSADRRRELLERAEKETIVLSQVAPGYPLVSVLFGNIWATRGMPSDLVIARDYFESAVRNVPHSTAMRTELIKIYRRLGQHEQAYRVVNEAIPWLPNETSTSALGSFAKEAESLALLLDDPKQARQWSLVRSRVLDAGRSGS